MPKARRYLVSAAGLKAVELELNQLETEIQDAVNSRQKSRERSLGYMKDGIIGLSKKLKLECACYLPKYAVRYKAKSCVCGRNLKELLAKAKIRGAGYSGASFDLAGDCRDREGKFVPVRNCTGRGPKAKKKRKTTKKKTSKKRAKRR